MVEMQIEYEGQLRCRAVHGPSGAVLATDAPVDNRGKGESFSPTDLLATSLGICMTTIMGIRARDRGIDLAGTGSGVVLVRAADRRRGGGRVALCSPLPAGFDPGERPGLEEAARTCPVALSVHPRIGLDLTFRWGPSS